MNSLYHPDLRDKSRAYIVLRSSIFSKWWFPQDEWIAWYGDCIREDGGNGMYCTSSQYAAWPAKQSSNDIKVGPS